MESFASIKKQLVVETWPIDKLIPYARNPRKNDEQVDRMCGVIREFGFRIPIVAKSDGTVVDGHLRLKAAQKLGLQEVPVALADELTDIQVKAFRLLANQSANWAEWDMDLLKLELDDLKLVNYDIDLIGFDEEDLKLLEDEGTTQENPQADETPNVPEVPVTQPGDVWLCGEHRLVCGDCTQRDTVALLMGQDFADLVFTDPPYNVNYSDKNRFLNAVCRGNHIQEPIQNDKNSSDEEAAEKVWEPAFANMRAFAQPHCSIYVTAPQGGAHGAMMMMMMKHWTMRHELVWVKNNHVLGRADYFYKHEPILYGWADKHIFYGKGEFNTSVWEIPKPQKNDLHPTMKPVRLVVNAIQNSSKEGDIVLDVFGGSGSTLIACEETGRKARLVELTPHYCDVIIRRWQELTDKQAVHAVSGKTFDEVCHAKGQAG